MSWLVIDFPPKGRTSDDVRMSVVRKDRTFGVSLLMSSRVLKTMGWSTDTWVVPQIGLDEDDGWLSLRGVLIGTSSDEHRRRKLQEVRRSGSARLVTPLFPWMECDGPIKAESVEARTKLGVLLLKLPDWARLPKPEAPPPPIIDPIEAAKARFGVK